MKGSKREKARRLDWFSFLIFSRAVCKLSREREVTSSCKKAVVSFCLLAEKKKTEGLPERLSRDLIQHEAKKRNSNREVHLLHFLPLEKSSSSCVLIAAILTKTGRDEREKGAFVSVDLSVSELQWGREERKTDEREGEGRKMWRARHDFLLSIDSKKRVFPSFFHSCTSHASDLGRRESILFSRKKQKKEGVFFLSNSSSSE